MKKLSVLLLSLMLVLKFVPLAVITTLRRQTPLKHQV